MNFENSIHKQFLQLADLITKEILIQVISAPQIMQQAIEQYRSKGFYVHSRKKETTIQLLGGTVIPIQTVYMLPRQSKKKRKKRGKGRHGLLGKGVYPVLKILGIAHRSSPALQNEVTLSALNNPFVEAQEILERHGIDLSEKRVRTISESVGAQALENRDQQLEQYEQGNLEQDDTFTGKRIVISIDGGRTRTRKNKKGNKKKNNKRKGYHTDWKEPKLYKIYAIDEDGNKLDQQLPPYSDGTLDGKEKFKQILKMNIYKTNVVNADQIICIGDGAPWIWNIFDEIIEDMNINSEKVYKVLDFYHASKHLWAVIDTMPQLTQPQKIRLFKKCRRLLKQGHIESLIEMLGKKAKGNKDVHKELEYFHGHEQKCRYDLFIQQNIPIGSGAIESTIRRVVNLRLKGAGMFWLKENAEAFLHLRCQLKANRWKQFFIKYINS